MNATHALESTVRIARLARTGLDIILFLALLGVFIHLKSLSDAHQADAQGKRFVASINGKTSKQQSTSSAEHVEEFHDSESAMWASFFNWQSKNNHATGSCQFSSPNIQSGHKFYMLCIGEQAQRGSTIEHEPMQVFMSNAKDKVDIKLNARKASKPENSPEIKLTPKGWLDTPRGRKHFDPTAKRWTP